MKNIEVYRNYFLKHKKRHIKRIQEFLQQPCIASLGVGGNEIVDLLGKYYRELGFNEVEKITTDSFPGFWAYYNSGEKKTIANYYMLDTPSAGNREWIAPPFQAKILTKNPLGKVIIARGARRRKGPLITWLNALEAIKNIEGKFPLNFVVLAESDEIAGSPNYRYFFNRYKSQIKKAHAVFCPGATQTPEGKSRITLGYKGILNIKFGISGKKSGKGPQEKPIHGMAQVLIESPVWRLIHALSILTDSETGSIKVTDFYADRILVTESEREEVKKLIFELKQKSWKELLPGVGKNIKSKNEQLDNLSAFLQYFYEPSFNLSGIASGYTGPGKQLFTLPNEAWATCDLRIPRGFSTEKTLKRIRTYMEKKGFEDLMIDVISYYEPYRNEVNSDLIKSLFKTLDKCLIEAEIWPYAASAGPWSIFTEEGMPSVFDLGIGYGGDENGINEYLLLDNYEKLTGLIDSELFFVRFIESFLNL